MSELTMPHNLQAEKIALGAMLLYPGDLLEGRDLLSPSDFYLHSHRRIHSAIVRLSASRRSGGQVDLVSLQQFMRDEGTLDAVGGIAYLASLDEVLPVRGSVRDYAAELRELANRRAVVRAASAALEAAQSGEASADTMAEIERAIIEIRAEATDDLIDSSTAVDRVNSSLRPENRQPALATGIAGIDSRTMGGIRRGELWVLGALPSRGKSSVARQIAARVTSSGVPTLVFSLEMAVEEWAGIDQANEAGVESWRLREPQHLTEARRQLLDAAGERLRARKMWFDESSEIHIDRIIAKARLAVLQKSVQLVVVDYAQRVTGSGRDLMTQMGDVSRKLAVFAKASKVAVLLLSQLKRPNDINSRPSFEDLKESGYLGAHAHTVLLNYRPVDRETENFVGMDELIIAKQRHGPIGSIPVRFNGDTLQFDSRERTQEEGPAAVSRPRVLQGGRAVGAR